MDDLGVNHWRLARRMKVPRKRAGTTSIVSDDYPIFLGTVSAQCGVSFSMPTPYRVILLIIGLAFFAIQGLAWPSGSNICSVQKQEKEVYFVYLRATASSASVRVLVTKTEAVRPDLDSINLQLAANGRGIPPDVRRDFELKNKTTCEIEPVVGIQNLRLISEKDKHSLFKTGWGEFYKKYGKDAEIVSLSQVGFNANHSLALLHVSGGIGPMAGGGVLYLFERKDDHWAIKTQIATWAT
jgi:hypothetical protein